MEGNVFALRLFDDTENQIISIVFNLGTLPGFSGGTLWEEPYTTFELDSDRQVWIGTSYDENWNAIGG